MLDIEKKRMPTVGQLVARDFRKAEVFTKYQIDFCCGGNITVEDACSQKSIDPAPVLAELKAFDETPDSDEVDYNTAPLDVLIEHIIDTHHAYVQRNINVILEYTQKVARVHGERLPEVIEINDAFEECCAELSIHMHKEEMIIFPFIREMVQAQKLGIPLNEPPFGSIRNPIQMMEHEHQKAGSAFERIRSISDDLTPPKGACMTHQISYHKLKEFETDLHTHIHLENNILFPRAIEMEKDLLQQLNESI